MAAAAAATSTSTPVLVVGGTGLVGRNILTHLLSQATPGIAPVHAIARRALSLPQPLLTSSNLIAHIEADSSAWASLIPSAIPKLFISALGTTRAQAESFAAQRLIDYDLNLSLAQAAKSAGAETYVLISVAGANATSLVPYTKMKGELEDAVQALGFKHTVIVRPGMIVGEREDSRMAETVLKTIAIWAGSVSSTAKDFWAQDADVIARAAVRAGTECVQGKRSNGQEGVWILKQADIVRMGKTA